MDSSAGQSGQTLFVTCVSAEQLLERPEQRSAFTDMGSAEYQLSPNMCSEVQTKC